MCHHMLQTKLIREFQATNRHIVNHDKIEIQLKKLFLDKGLPSEEAFGSIWIRFSIPWHEILSRDVIVREMALETKLFCQLGALFSAVIICDQMKLMTPRNKFITKLGNGQEVTHLSDANTANF